MRLSNLLPVVLISLIAINSGCKKDNPTTNNNNPQKSPVATLFGAGPTIPSNASGALYAVNSVVYKENVGTVDTTSGGLGFAWFIDADTTLNAGTVTCNSDSLFRMVPPSGTYSPWYASSSIGTGIDFSGVAAAWNISGSTVVTPFNYTDNTAFPVVNGFTLASTVSVNSDLTINFSVTNSFDQVICFVAGGKGRVIKNLTAAGSVTFTAAEVQQAAFGGGSQLSVQIMPIKMTSAIIAGKTYYFVKQQAYTRYASTI